MCEPMSRPTVLLADDHETILAQVRAMLAVDFEIIGVVNNGQDAVTEVRRLDPDVLVIDISMPVLDGLQAASQLRSINQRTKIVFLTVHSEEDFIDAAFVAGGSCYVTKSDITTDLVPAIYTALQGGTFVSQSIPK